MAKLVDAPHSKCGDFGRESSSLSPPIESYCIIVHFKVGGVRSFLTGFDGEKFIDIGNRDITRVFRYRQHIDKLISTKTRLKGSKNKHKRQGLQNKINGLFIRIRNLIDEVHKKVAKWLTTEPERYLYPYF